MRTFQEIYDFCRNDRTYRTYYDVPDQFACTQKQYRYYYHDVRGGQCRRGTFIFHQRCVQLERFLRGLRQDFYLHIFPHSYKEADRQKHEDFLIFIVAHVEERGVHVKFTHPYTGDDIYFIARSHRPFNKEGLIGEVKAYIDKHLLLPPGRYRDLQVEYKISKEKFPGWYKTYKERIHIAEEQAHWDMIEKYQPDNRMSYEDSYNLLAASGMFFDFNCDEYERNQMTEEFMDICNR